MITLPQTDLSGPITLTYQEINQLLKDAIAERGEEFVYERPVDGDSCLNWHHSTDEPGCIIGWIAWKIRGADDLRVNERGSSGLLFEALNIRVDSTTASMLSYIQGLQDSGVPWGQAVIQGKASELDARMKVPFGE